MAITTELNRPRRVPSAFLGLLCVMGAAFSLWLAIGPVENLPFDFQEVESVVGEARASAQVMGDLLQKLQDVGDDRSARGQLQAELNREVDSTKRRQEGRMARRLSDIQRKRWVSAALAGILALLAAKLFWDGMQSRNLKSRSGLNLPPSEQVQSDRDRR